MDAGAGRVGRPRRDIKVSTCAMLRWAGMVIMVGGPCDRMNTKRSLVPALMLAAHSTLAAATCPQCRPAPLSGDYWAPPN